MEASLVCWTEHLKNANLMELLGQDMQSEHHQLHPGAKPQVGLWYFHTFETCKIWFFLFQLHLFLLHSECNLQAKNMLSVEFCGSAKKIIPIAKTMTKIVFSL